MNGTRPNSDMSVFHDSSLLEPAWQVYMSIALVQHAFRGATEGFKPYMSVVCCALYHYYCEAALLVLEM